MSSFGAVCIISCVQISLGYRYEKQCHDVEVKQTLYRDFISMECNYDGKTGVIIIYGLKSDKKEQIGYCYQQQCFLEEQTQEYELISKHLSQGTGAVLTFPCRNLKGKFICEAKFGDCEKTAAIDLSDHVDGESACTKPGSECATQGSCCSCNECDCADCEFSKNDQSTPSADCEFSKNDQSTRSADCEFSKNDQRTPKTDSQNTSNSLVVTALAIYFCIDVIIKGFAVFIIMVGLFAIKINTCSRLRQRLIVWLRANRLLRRLLVLLLAVLKELNTKVIKMLECMENPAHDIHNEAGNGHEAINMDTSAYDRQNEGVNGHAALARDIPTHDRRNEGGNGHTAVTMNTSAHDRRNEGGNGHTAITMDFPTLDRQYEGGNGHAALARDITNHDRQNEAGNGHAAIPMDAPDNDKQNEAGNGQAAIPRDAPADDKQNEAGNGQAVIPMDAPAHDRHNEAEKAQQETQTAQQETSISELDVTTFKEPTEDEPIMPSTGRDEDERNTYSTKTRVPSQPNLNV